MKNKKGLAMAQLVTITLVVVGFLVITTAVGVAMSKNSDQEAELACHNSVGIRAMTAVSSLGSSKIKVAPLLCKTIDRDVTGDREKVKAQLAHMMGRCWWMFHKGKFDEIVDSSTSSAGKVLGLTNNNACFMCYSAAIKSDELKKKPITSLEMFEYLRDNKVPNQKINFLEYIQKSGGQGKIAILEKQIKDGSGYGVMFLAKNAEKSNWNLFAPIAYVGGAIVGAACIVSGFCIVGGILIAGVSVASGGMYLSTVAEDIMAKARDDLYGGDDRKNSVIVLDSLAGVDYGGCLVKDIAGDGFA